MGRGKSKQQKASRKKDKQKKKAMESSAEADAKSWYGQICFDPIAVAGNGADSPNSPESFPSSFLDVSIISWNVLAESYCSVYSHPHLTESSQKYVFNPTRRRKRLCECIRTLAKSASIVCLQEVDRPEILRTLEGELGYVGVSTPTSKNGSSGCRKDACTIHVDPSVWEIMDHEIIRFDDLASDVNIDGDEPITVVSQHLQGIRHSFLRRNAGVLVRLRNDTTTIVVANTHLFWNPAFEYIKLCQAHYLLLRAKKFRLSLDEEVIICGDMNSKPSGPTYKYFTHGFSNAKAVAPWYNSPGAIDSGVQDEEIVAVPAVENQLSESETADLSSQDDSLSGIADNATFDLTEKLDALKVSDRMAGSVSDDVSATSVRYLVDASLNKLCRWLRILGQDVALETEEEEIRRTKHNDFQIIGRCKDENRTLITTSPKLMQRRDCPASSYCITPTFLPTQKLEVALVHLLKTHGVVLEPTRFLSRCVVCNGLIVPLADTQQKRAVLEEYDAPTDVLLDGPVYCCSHCGQGYWWNDQPNSSASRVKLHCTHLFELCLRAGIPCNGPMGMFDFVDVDTARNQGWDTSVPGSGLLEESVPAVEWLRSECLRAPIQLKSAYSDGRGGELLPFTNVTAGFIDTLDYIFYSSSCTVTHQLHVPKTFDELAEGIELRNAHLLPSRVWPSDHLAIGATIRIPVVEPFQFCMAEGEFLAQPPSMFPLHKKEPPHGNKCDCGCVPPVPSMFEMAEKRRKYREQQRKLESQKELALQSS